MYTLSTEKKLAVISGLVEGNSIRSISRMTDVGRNTITSLLLPTGDYCADLMDGSMRNLHCGFVQADEIWCYVGKKDRHLRKGDSPELGSQWVFVAMDECIQSASVPKRQLGISSTNWQSVFRCGYGRQSSSSTAGAPGFRFAFYRSENYERTSP